MKILILNFLFLCILSNNVYAELITAVNNPLPDNYLLLAEEKIKEKLIDPESAKFKLKREPIFESSKGQWRCEIFVNAKNRFGGYVGFEEWWCYIDNDKIVNCDLEPYTKIKKLVQ